MSFLDFINPFNKVADIVDKAVLDKDMANNLKGEILKLGEQVYLQELSTKTVPWVDALHKMTRPIGTWISYGLCAYMVHTGITDPIALAACFAPGGIYNFVKGKGK